MSKLPSAKQVRAMKLLIEELEEENALLEEVVQEIGDLDLDLAKKFYRSLWKVIGKSLEKGRWIRIPLKGNISIKHHKQGLYFIKKKETGIGWVGSLSSRLGQSLFTETNVPTPPAAPPAREN